MADVFRIRSKSVVDATGEALVPLDFARYLIGARGVVTRLIASVATSGSDLLRDDFQRTVAAGGWGSPDVGPAWSVLEEGGTLFVDGARGRSTQGVVTRNAIQSPIAAADAEMLYLLATANQPSGGGSTGDQARAILRVQDLNNYYYASVENFFIANAQTIRVARRLAGVEANLASLAVGVGELLPPIWIRFSVIGTALQAKAWRWGSPEPTSALVSANDGNITAAGGAGCGFTAPGATGTDFMADALVVSPGSAVVTNSPSWKAFVGDVNDPSNLVDSSQGAAIPSWVPSLVNGQPVFQGDILTIEADNASPGAIVTVSCYLAVEKI